MFALVTLHHDTVIRVTDTHFLDDVRLIDRGVLELHIPGSVLDLTVITSYSIHYTKLYDMIGIVIVTHRRLGDALIEAAEFIMDERPEADAQQTRGSGRRCHLRGAWPSH